MYSHPQFDVTLDFIRCQRQLSYLICAGARDICNCALSITVTLLCFSSVNDVPLHCYLSVCWMHTYHREMLGCCIPSNVMALLNTARVARALQRGLPPLYTKQRLSPLYYNSLSYVLSLHTTPDALCCIYQPRPGSLRCYNLALRNNNVQFFQDYCIYNKVILLFSSY